jgi:serine/threonine protein kinase
MGRDIARALGELHAMGIVAMDLKPDNILMTDSDVAVLADFGISKVLEATTAATSTALGFRGTYAYT